MQLFWLVFGFSGVIAHAWLSGGSTNYPVAIAESIISPISPEFDIRSFLIVWITMPAIFTSGIYRMGGSGRKLNDTCYPRRIFLQ
jgi:hypothetical protein